MIYILAHTTARNRAAQAVKDAPDGFVVEVREPKRSSEQSALLHALLTEVGTQLGWKWQGFTIDLDDLKSIFVAAYRKIDGRNAKVLPGIEGEPVLLGWRTRDMSRREMGDLITMIQAWQAENIEVNA